MPDQLLTDYLFVLVFLLVGFVFAVVPIALAFFITPRGLGLRKLVTYESGMPPIGGAWIQFGVAYYLFALIFPRPHRVVLKWPWVTRAIYVVPYAVYPVYLAAVWPGSSRHSMVVSAVPGCPSWLHSAFRLVGRKELHVCTISRLLVRGSRTTR